MLELVLIVSLRHVYLFILSIMLGFEYQAVLSAVVCFPFVRDLSYSIFLKKKKKNSAY